MTLSELDILQDDWLTVEQVANCLKCSPQLIRDQAEREPRYLGFPICKVSHRYRIPREGFLNWARGKTPVMVYKAHGNAADR